MQFGGIHLVHLPQQHEQYVKLCELRQMAQTSRMTRGNNLLSEGAADFVQRRLFFHSRSRTSDMDRTLVSSMVTS